MFKFIIFPFALCAILLAETSTGAVIYRTVTYYAGMEGIAVFDLDRDSENDIHLDLGYAAPATADFPFVLTGLGPAMIVASDGITTSFSQGDIVTISSLPLVGGNQSVLTGGVVTDVFGNVICEGWGGVTSDEFGNATIPPGGPTHQIDMFLVRLPQGVAWVDLDTHNLIFGYITANWGFLSPGAETFAISGVPEPTTPFLLAVTGCFALVFRSRECRTR